MATKLYQMAYPCQEDGHHMKWGLALDANALDTGQDTSHNNL